VGLTIVDGLHVGGSFHYVMDSISVLQASDPLGTEGLFAGEPYIFDTVLEASGDGGHTGFGAGLFFDKFEFAQIGLSYTSGGKWNVDGEASISGDRTLLPDGPATGVVSLSQPLPAVIRAHLVSKIAMLELGAGVEYQAWAGCCSGPDADLTIGVTDENGDPLKTTAGEISTTIYSPRRLRNSMNFILTGSMQATPKLWIGTRLGYNTSAVPDYAVSATNLDFESVGAMLAARYKFGPVGIGLAYTKFIPFKRTITNSAWNAPLDSDDYVDDRFSPQLPYKANTNGEYKAVVDIIGVRVQASI
jgi:long-subunit fatty acid transport protein